MSLIYAKIDGITCEGCRNRIINKLEKINNIDNVIIEKNIATINYKKRLDKQRIINTINSLGYFTKDSYISNNKEELLSNISIKEFIAILILIIAFVAIINHYFNFSAIPVIDNSITYGMLFITGLFTSIHCISMCGAINLLGTFNTDNKINIKKPLFYNLGRVISYTLIGGISGMLGNIISFNDIINGIIIIAAAVLMFLISLSMLGIVQFRIPRINLLKNKNKTKNSFLLGLVNGFMPCGPLQAMQVYALSTASFFKGALSMFLFSIGTVPLMLCFGIFFNLFKGKGKIILNKIASILVLFLSVMMLERGLNTLGINTSFKPNNYNGYTKAVVYDNYQKVNINLDYNDYKDILVQKGTKVKLIINVDKRHLTGCNNEIVIKEFNINKKLKVGKNVIEFTPKKRGVFTMNCWMNMIKNNIKVVDDKKAFEVMK